MALRTKSWTGRKEWIMYTGEQKEKALAMYDATQSTAEVIRRLGYPSKQALYTWIANRDKPWQKPNGFRGVNTADHPRHPSVNLKFFYNMKIHFSVTEINRRPEDLVVSDGFCKKE